MNSLSDAQYYAVLSAMLLTSVFVFCFLIGWF